MIISLFFFSQHLSTSFLSDCVNQGWSILVFAGQAEIGDWKGAWSNMQALNESVFYEAGGNGHSRSNCLWYVSTRPDYKMAVSAPSRLPSKLSLTSEKA
jgi:hypothetical protein